MDCDTIMFIPPALPDRILKMKTKLSLVSYHAVRVLLFRWGGVVESSLEIALGMKGGGILCTDDHFQTDT